MMKLAGKILAYFVLIIFISLVGITYFIGMTSEGLQLTLKLATTFLPGKLEIGQASGKLFSGFNLNHISYADSTQITSINTLHLAWDPTQLLHGKILIQDLSFNHVRVNLIDNTKSSGDSFDWNSLVWLNKIILQRAQVQDLTINGTFNGFPIKSSANITFENNQLEIHNTQLAIASSTLNLTGSLKDTWHVQWQIHVPKLETLVQGSQGTFTSNGTISGPAFSPKIDANLEGNHLSFGQQSIEKISGEILFDLKTQKELIANLSIQNFTSKDYTLESIALTANGKLLEDKLLSTINLTINNNQNQISGTVILPKFAKKIDIEQPIESKINLRFSEFKSLIPATPYAKHPKGILTGQAEITGTLSHPIFSGHLNLQKGHIKVTKLGVKINDINLTANYDKKNQITLNGQFQSGDGSATLQGNIDITQSSLILNLQGHDLQIANTAEYKVNLSPDLTLTANPSETHLHGRITIPYAEIIANHFGNTVSLPADVVMVGKPETTSNMPTNLSMQIHLKLGDDVHLAYDALKTKLGGNLRITQNAGSEPFATGELSTLKGNYRAYGHTLTIQKGGRLIYTGSPLSNPGLDIQAVTLVKRSTMSAGSEQVTVGVQLSGTANQPFMSLFSSPAGLTQGDILSYIIFGYPQAQVAGSKSLALLSAATSTLNMNGANVNKMTKKVEKYLGHVDITTESIETFNPKSNTVEASTTIGIGKQLAPNLYLHYSVGNGVDLMYGFEYD